MDEDADGTLESSERYYILNDSRWRPVATFRDQDVAAKEAFVFHAGLGRLGERGGSSYIDSVTLRGRNNSTDSDHQTPLGPTASTDSRNRTRRWLFITVVAATCALLLFALLEKERALRLADGVVEDRYFLAGMRIVSSDRESALGLLRVDRSDSTPAGELLVVPRRHLLTTGPTPSTFGGRFVTQCKTIGEILKTQNADADEIQHVWRMIAVRGAARADVDDVIQDLLSRR